MNNGWKNFISPFTKIAGTKALLWGLAGLTVSAVASYFSGWHANGLMHFGGAPRDAWWLPALEYLIIWLIPAIIFYGLGVVLSRSRIRPVDVLGTTAFALLPLAPLNLLYLLPYMKKMLAAVTPPLEIERVVALVGEFSFFPVVLFLLAVMALTLVWLFDAVRVSCNLKGWRLWTVFLVGVIGGDALCQLLLRLVY